MKLTLKIKLIPNEAQAEYLLETIKETNTARNAISEIAWDRKVFKQFKLHKESYYAIKETFNLSSQVIIRCIADVANSYKLDRKKKRTFKKLSGITYDNRILSYKPNNHVSIWSVNGRLHMPFVCHNEKYLPYIKGESDLVYKNGKFYLFQVVDIPDIDIEDMEDFIGVDFGISSIAFTSTGKDYSSKELNAYREEKQKVRGSLQRKGTKNAKKVLKRLSGRERTHSNIVNHTIAKQIVKEAKNLHKGIAIEDLTGIRFTSKRRNKKFRTKLGKWSFHDLRKKIEYKAEMNGIPVVAVKPAYTSKTCHSCKHIGKRTDKVFKCTNHKCEVDTVDADWNASINISSWGFSINNPEKSNMFCALAHDIQV